jgi:hypothetical protein
MYVTAFPDLHLEIEQQLADGDFVVTRWIVTGTHRSVLMGVEPTADPAPPRLAADLANLGVPRGPRRLAIGCRR